MQVVFCSEAGQCLPLQAVCTVEGSLEVDDSVYASQILIGGASLAHQHNVWDDELQHSKEEAACQTTDEYLCEIAREIVSAEYAGDDQIARHG